MKLISFLIKVHRFTVDNYSLLVNSKKKNSHRDLLTKYLFDGDTFLENAYLFEA